MKLISMALMFIVIGCAGVNKTRKNLVKSQITIHGGVFHEKEWKDKLVFKRYSWFEETIMNYDILTAKIDRNSPFFAWMESDAFKASECAEFSIGLFYAKLRSEGVSYLTSQFEKSGHVVNILPEFGANLRAHHNMEDWELTRYKVFGICRKEGNKRSIKVYIPGYSTYKVR